jgi:hypothetical protein
MRTKDLYLRIALAALFILGCTTGIYAQAELEVESHESEEGFIRIFDGKSLEGWDGDPVYWSVEEGAILGTITPETIVERNTFLIWRGGTTGDFELKLEYRISSEGNSGINYRSYEVPGVPWALKGYQSDIDGQGQWNGQNYEERGRTFLALRGQVSRITKEGKPTIIGSVGDRDELQELIHKEQWNQCHLIVRGRTMIHMINGHIMSVVIDDDAENRTMDGLLGVQVHVGPPMTVEYKNIMIKKL